MSKMLASDLYTSQGEAAHIAANARVAVLGPGRCSLTLAHPEERQGPMDANIFFLSQHLRHPGHLYVLDLPAGPQDGFFAGAHGLSQIRSCMGWLEGAGAALCGISYLEGAFLSRVPYACMAGSTQAAMYDVVVDHGTGQWILNNNSGDAAGIVEGFDRLLAPGGKAIVYGNEGIFRRRACAGELLEDAFALRGYSCRSYGAFEDAYRVRDPGLLGALRECEARREECRREGVALSRLLLDDVVFPTYRYEHMVVASKGA